MKLRNAVFVVLCALFVACFHLLEVGFEINGTPDDIQDSPVPKFATTSSPVLSTTRDSTSGQSSDPSTPRVFIFKLYQHGLFSQLINLFCAAVYFEMYHNRTVLVDESQYHYRRSKEIGVLTGFFSPQLPVADTKQDVDRLMGRDYEETQGQYTDDMPIIYDDVFGYRDRIFDRIERNSQDLYTRLVDHACRHLRFNEDTTREIQELYHDFPSTDFSNMAAFHIRRGDKLREESRKYHANEYVTKYLEVASNASHPYCFVASDDFRAVNQLKDALASRNVPCKLLTLTRPEEKGHRRPTKEFTEVIEFLAEINVLIQADVFVGTFNSNVGSLGAVLRACHHDAKDHFARSYGVDEEWFIK